MKQQDPYRRITTSVIAVAMLFFSVTPFATSTPAAEARPDAGENDISEGAKQFDDAVSDVAEILRTDLSTEKGVREAAAILKRNERKLAQVEKKALHAAMRVTAFQKGLKDEAAKRKGGAEELARELAANHDLIGSIPGASEAARAISESTRPAAETLKKVSEALRKAADEGRAKNSPGNLHHAYSREVPAAEAQGFCGSYQYICDLLQRLGQYYLRRQLSEIAATGRKANCVLTAYVAYSRCSIARWWDLAYCNSQLSLQIWNCILFTS